MILLLSFKSIQLIILFRIAHNSKTTVKLKSKEYYTLYFEWIALIFIS